ncbi:iron-sulfur cluster assembly protein [Caldisericum exile]|uniref:MIP18 family-like domain-containing protein n=1 Tax=Caldisericum exile (strain DSM 21853 / NBRC 104410 / AZM16c01) TaxID=511051 RepID=A0A7U6GEQ9_CALEA|nr:iron-sulfur cluster assembly protein [Caldisericum exile]BAL81045.1 hypothetical protein CSE_09190 [Caldisericum exile AZM16c01]
MNELERKIIEALKKVKDPETGNDIISENLVYGFTPKEQYIKVFVSFEGSTPTCNFCKAISWTIIDKISSEIISALKEIGFETVEVVEELNPKLIYKAG